MGNKDQNSVVFFGDSITQFWEQVDPLFFTENKFINKGISGQTTSQMLLRFYDDIIALQPKAVVILAGINDIAENTGPITDKEIADNIIKLVEMATKNNINVYLCSVLPANKFSWNTKILPANKVISLNKMIENFAKNNKIQYINYYSQMVDSEKGLKKMYGEDGVHPNFDGYSIMKSIVNKHIR